MCAPRTISPEISTEQLKSLLEERKGAYPVTITSRTLVKMNKSVETESGSQPNPYYNRITKVAIVNGMANWIYSNSVNNQREREGKETDFVAHPRSWGRRLPGLPFVEHNGVFYLEMKVEKSLDYHYLLDGDKPIDKTEVEPYLPKKKESARQKVDRPVILRDYMLSNIEEISINGEHFIINKNLDDVRVAA